MPFLLLGVLESNWLGFFFVFTLLMAFKSAVTIYAAADKTGHEKPEKWALIVAFSYVGTPVVGIPVSLVVWGHFILKLEKMEKRKRLEGE